jgi:trk system potassium uptake protein
MNYRYVWRQLGLLILLLSAALAVAAVGAMIPWSRPREPAGSAALALLLSAGTALAVGAGLWLGGRSSTQAWGRREALLLVASSWMLGAVLVSLPFFFWGRVQGHAPPDHPFRRPVDCFFEGISGLTTTGSTILSEIQSLPPGLLLWRAMTHWIGGLGIVVLFVAVLPALGAGSRKVFQAEVPGPPQHGLRPRIREAARIVLIIYVAMNVAEILALRLAGLSWFDAICESFATIATGGFSSQNASTAGYRSAAAEAIIIVFMFLAGVNFALYYGLFKRGVGAIWSDAEFRVYLGITVISCVCVVAAIWGQPILLATGDELEPGMAAATRHGIFQVVSIRTNTGFATADVNPWGGVPHMILVFFMFTGASAGSTAGGVKLIRCIIVFKLLAGAVERAFRPSVVRPIRVGSDAVDQEASFEAMIYILLYLVVWFGGAMVVYLLETSQGIDLGSALTASAACLSNTGPGLGLVGTVQNYQWMSDASKLVLSLVMLLGRLEMYAIFALLLPRFWWRD